MIFMFEPDFSVINVLLPETQHTCHTGVDTVGTLLLGRWVLSVIILRCGCFRFFIYISTLIAKERRFC